MNRVKIGLESALEIPDPSWRTSRIGLLTNNTGITPSFESGIDLVHNHPDINLVALYGPEHGVRGGAQAGDKVADDSDPRTGLPVFSLYGASQTPSAEVLSHIDVLLIDIQDIGVRYTTYVSCVAEVLTACDTHGVEVVIFDRPNPLGGTIVAGNMLEPAFRSYVGCHEMPILHGLTIAEFGRLWARDHNLRQPGSVTMSGWNRDQTYDQTGLPWVLPSPNLPTLDSILVYGGTCLFEGTVLSEGRGTTRPFELFGAPWIDADSLAAELNALNAPGVAFRPAHFIPSFSKHAGAACQGVQVHVTNRNILDSVNLGPHMLATVKRMYPEHFGWVPSDEGRIFIDILAGTDQLRLAIDEGRSIDDLLTGWRKDADGFLVSRQDILLYQ